MKKQLFTSHIGTATCIVSIAFLIAIDTCCIAQVNLAPNPSFEDTVACPFGLVQIDNAIGWSSYSGTPDYFNSCAPSGGFSVSVPENIWGFQFARTGNAYAGLFTFYKTLPNSREYIGIQLSEPLVINQKYFASFYVSRAVSKNPYINVATNKIGLRMSTIPYSYFEPAPSNNSCQIYSDSTISDTKNWVRVSGSFIADSAYRYLSIGNFFVDSLTSAIFYDTTATTVVAYYYVDDVYLSTDSLEAIFPLEEEESVKIFPNAAQDWITIEGRAIQAIELIDIFGNIYETPSPAKLTNQHSLYVGNLNRGYYIVRIKTPNNAFYKNIILK